MSAEDIAQFLLRLFSLDTQSYPKPNLWIIYKPFL